MPDFIELDIGLWPFKVTISDRTTGEIVWEQIIVEDGWFCPIDHKGDLLVHIEWADGTTTDV